VNLLKQHRVAVAVIVIIAGLSLFGLREYRCKLRGAAFAGQVESLSRVISGQPLKFTTSAPINCSVINGVRCISPGNPQGWAGRDPGAWINSASIGCTPCTIQLSSGTYNVTTPVQPNSQVILQGAGRKATYLSWTGSSSGTLVNLPPGSADIQIRDMTLQNANLSVGTGFGIKMAAATNINLQNIVIAGFKTNLYSTGDKVSLITNGLVIKDSFVLNNSNISAYDFKFDHTANVVIDNVQAGAASVADVVFDSNSQGFSFRWFNIFQGAAGAIFRCTGVNGSGSCTSGTGSYDYPPWGFEADQFLVDAIANTGDSLLFDSSLGANALDMKFTNFWATGGTNALHISGGRKLTFAGGGTIRGSNGNGVLIDNANVADVIISDLHITNNNEANADDAHGIYITAAVGDIHILGNTIGNITEPFGGGHQLYGIKVAAVNVGALQIIGNDLGGNITGPINNANTNPYSIVSENAPNFYTVGSLPTASLWGAGAKVMVVDASAFTVGTCVGGGSDPMTAISNGTTWSCH
jgi:hypothetical protein